MFGKLAVLFLFERLNSGGHLRQKVQCCPFVGQSSNFKLANGLNPADILLRTEGSTGNDHTGAEVKTSFLQPESLGFESSNQVGMEGNKKQDYQMIIMVGIPMMQGGPSVWQGQLREGMLQTLPVLDENVIGMLEFAVLNNTGQLNCSLDRRKMIAGNNLKDLAQQINEHIA